jgi:hypothetical protein
MCTAGKSAAATVAEAQQSPAMKQKHVTRDKRPTPFAAVMVGFPWLVAGIICLLQGHDKKKEPAAYS